jgi:hypothetical protein
MSGYLCSNCGESLEDDELACPECGMPRAPRGEGPLVEADVRTDPGVGFTATEESGHAAALHGAALAQPQGGKGNFRPAKKKNAGFSRTLQPAGVPSARKKTPRKGPLMPLILILALAWIGGMAFLAYRFFIPKDGVSENSVEVVYQDSGQPQAQTEDTPPEPAIQPLAQEEASARHVWSDADADGYSNLMPSASGLTPVLYGTVLGDRVRLRSEPNTDSKIINHYNKGAKVEIMRRYAAPRDEYPWYNIKVNGRVGWMYGQYVSEIKQ